MDTALVPAMVWRIDRTRSRVGFVARHMAVSAIRGEFRRWSADVRIDERDWTRSSILASVDSESIDTSNADRDDHLRTLFDVRRHPKAVFESRRIEMIDDRLEVVGALSLHGITNDASWSADVTTSGDRVCFEATTTIHRKAFALQWSAILEWTGGVGDRVDVTVHLEAVRTSEA